jgi:hypothetical protein
MTKHQVNRAGRPALVAAVVLSGCTAAPSAAPAVSAAPTGCAYHVRRDALPDWARSGFSDPSGTPYVMGTKGEILGVLFGYPLTEPSPSGGRTNKILWLSRVATYPDTLKISARLDGSGEPVTREVSGGPGSSIIDLPHPGCWHLTLNWSRHTDTLDLRYESG